jgi:predicted DNA-binding transcriptional regulator AlpA
MALHELAPRPMPGSIEPLLDIPRAAHLLGISRKTLRDWI